MTVNFRPVIDQFDIYLTAKCSEPPKHKNFPARVISFEGQEAMKRLRQLDWLCRKIGEYEANSVEFLDFIISQGKSSDAGSQDNWAAISASEENSLEMEIFVEGFYYIAFRLRNVIQRLPGLNNFECEGVRNVRNHLIEHPEKNDSGVIHGCMSSGNRETGPVLKWTRLPLENILWQDEGLWVNARELAQNLTEKINAALGES